MRRIGFVVLVGLPVLAGACRKSPMDREPGTQTREEVDEMRRTARDLSPMIRIEGGCFRMGTDNPPAAPEGLEGNENICVQSREDGGVRCFGVYEDEMPAHEVCLDPFEIDEHEVTFEAFQLCAAPLICEPSPLASNVVFWGPHRPAAGVAWEAARTFCEWIGRRLPTEAEWEFAARGTDGRTYPWGEEKPECGRLAMKMADVEGACDRYGTKNVMTYPLDRSPFGVLDMGGNVREWVSDYYDPDYYRSLAGVRTRNPTGPEQPMRAVVNTLGEGPEAEVITLVERQRVLRGGTFLFGDDLTAFRAVNRRGLDEKTNTLEPIVSVGFRCARSIPPPGSSAD
jgi:formylglycine-generating enzyme required for sulfatase activity